MRGQTLIELLVVIGIMSLVLPALFGGFVASRENQGTDTERIQAVILQKEAFEAVRSMREDNWSNIESIPVNTARHPVIASALWTLPANAETLSINGVSYTRDVRLFNVNRNATSGEIVSTGGVVDPSTKRVEVTISWSGQPALVSSQYLSRYLNNQSIQQPTVTYTFPAGTGDDVDITASEVNLGAVDTGRADWCVPKPIGTLDLPKSAAAIPIMANPFEAFVGLGNDTARPSFVKVSITDTITPNNPTFTQSGQFPTTGTGYIVNDVYGEGDYAYLATTDNTKEIVILQKSGSNFAEVGTFRPSGNGDANSVFVSGNRGFMTQENNLRVFDLSAKTGSRSQLGTATFGGSGATGEVFIRGNYAFVAIQGHENELEISNITTNTPQKVAYGSVNGAAAQDIFVNPDGDRAYIVTNYDASLPEFFILDTTNKNTPLHALPAPIGQYNTTDGMSPRAVEIVLNDYRAVIAGSGGQQYQVLDLMNEATPVKCGGLTTGVTLYDLAAVKEPDGDAYMYGTAALMNGEFNVMEGGPGNLLAPEGTYESPAMTLTANAMFNRFSATVDKPAGTNIRFQVAVAQAVSNACTAASYSFVGPDGSAASYYQTTSTGTNIEIADKVPFSTIGSYTNPGRCFKYRTTLNPTSNLLTSPALKSVKVNYTP